MRTYYLDTTFLSRIKNTWKNKRKSRLMKWPLMSTPCSLGKNSNKDFYKAIQNKNQRKNSQKEKSKKIKNKIWINSKAKLLTGKEIWISPR